MRTLADQHVGILYRTRWPRVDDPIPLDRQLAMVIAWKLRSSSDNYDPEWTRFLSRLRALDYYTYLAFLIHLSWTYDQQATSKSTTTESPRSDTTDRSPRTPDTPSLPLHPAFYVVPDSPTTRKETVHKRFERRQRPILRRTHNINM